MAIEVKRRFCGVNERDSQTIEYAHAHNAHGSRQSNTSRQFENLADIDHVRHAYEHLAEGGRLVSVMGESPFFRRDRKAQAFRTWLFDVGGRDIELEQGAFAESGTNVKARIVVIDR